MSKQISIAILLILSNLLAFSQASLKGKLVDSASKKPMSLATITVFLAADTSIVNYRLSDPKGEFKVPSLPSGIGLRVIITSSGYKVMRKEFTLEPNQQLDMGTIVLQTDTTELDAVLVYAERPPISVKRDTIEFNASAFKTLPTALVEDLLKKFPGVEIDPDGNMRVNGRAVNRILVDGKDFFGGDPKIATRNLPANLIDKVQVTDDKEQLDRNPDINKADLGQVINLKLKKAIKQGWFGKAYAGGGLSDGDNRGLYEAGAIVNTFRDTLQISVLGYTNNLNRAGFGFSDLEKLGGFGRVGVNSISIWSDGGIALNGVSFGATGQGIQRSTGGGINLNHDPSKKLKINFQYFFGHVNSDLEKISSSTQKFNDTSLTVRNSIKENSNDYNHRFGLRINWKADSLTTIDFRPSFTIRNYDSKRQSDFESFSNFDPKLNSSVNNERVESNEVGYSHEASLNRLFRKKGRVLFLNTNFSINNTGHNQYNDVQSTFYNGGTAEDDRNQWRRRDYDNLVLSGSITYTEPLSKSLSLRVSNSTNYFKDDDAFKTLDWNPITNQYDVINPGLTNGLDRNGLRNIAGLNLVKRWKKLTITPGVQALSLNIDNRYQTGTPLKQQFFFVLPTINISYGAFNVGYRVSVREPSLTDLRPIADSTNPLYVNLGNPDLQPTVSHGINGSVYKYNSKTQISYNIYSNVNFANDAVVRSRSVSPNGVQVTNPVNADGNWNASLSASINKQFKLVNNWQLSLRPNFSFNYSKNLLIVNDTRSRLTGINTSPSMYVSFNWKDKVEFNQRYGINWRKNTYEADYFQDVDVITHTASTEFILRAPKNFVWESSLDYRYNPQVAPGIRKSVSRLNAGLTYLFLKDQKGQLKISAFDLLNQNVTSYRTVSENYITDSQIKALTRYYMLTFTYNIRDFKGGKVGGRQNFFFF